MESHNASMENEGNQIGATLQGQVEGDAVSSKNNSSVEIINDNTIPVELALSFNNLYRSAREYKGQIIYNNGLSLSRFRHFIEEFIKLSVVCTHLYGDIKRTYPFLFHSLSETVEILISNIPKIPEINTISRVIASSIINSATKVPDNPDLSTEQKLEYIKNRIGQIVLLFETMLNDRIQKHFGWEESDVYVEESPVRAADDIPVLTDSVTKPVIDEEIPVTKVEVPIEAEDKFANKPELSAKDQRLSAIQNKVYKVSTLQLHKKLKSPQASFVEITNEERKNYYQKAVDAFKANRIINTETGEVDETNCENLAIDLIELTTDFYQEYRQFGTNSEEVFYDDLRWLAKSYFNSVQVKGIKFFNLVSPDDIEKIAADFILEIRNNVLLASNFSTNKGRFASNIQSELEEIKTGNKLFQQAVETGLIERGKIKNEISAFREFLSTCGPVINGGGRIHGEEIGEIFDKIDNILRLSVSYLSGMSQSDFFQAARTGLTEIFSDYLANLKIEGVPVFDRTLDNPGRNHPEAVAGSVVDQIYKIVQNPHLSGGTVYQRFVRLLERLKTDRPDLRAALRLEYSESGETVINGENGSAADDRSGSRISYEPSVIVEPAPNKIGPAYMPVSDMISIMNDNAREEARLQKENEEADKRNRINMLLQKIQKAANKNSNGGPDIDNPVTIKCVEEIISAIAEFHKEVNLAGGKYTSPENSSYYSAIITTTFYDFLKSLTHKNRLIIRNEDVRKLLDAVVQPVISTLSSTTEENFNSNCSEARKAYLGAIKGLKIILEEGEESDDEEAAEAEIGLTPFQKCAKHLDKMRSVLFSNSTNPIAVIHQIDGKIRPENVRKAVNYISSFIAEVQSAELEASDIHYLRERLIDTLIDYFREIRYLGCEIASFSDNSFLITVNKLAERVIGNIFDGSGSETSRAEDDIICTVNLILSQIKTDTEKVQQKADAITIRDVIDEEEEAAGDSIKRPSSPAIVRFMTRAALVLAGFLSPMLLSGDNNRFKSPPETEPESPAAITATVGYKVGNIMSSDPKLAGLTTYDAATDAAKDPYESGSEEDAIADDPEFLSDEGWEIPRLTPDGQGIVPESDIVKEFKQTLAEGIVINKGESLIGNIIKLIKEKTGDPEGVEKFFKRHAGALIRFLQQSEIVVERKKDDKIKINPSIASLKNICDPGAKVMVKGQPTEELTSLLNKSSQVKPTPKKAAAAPKKGASLLDKIKTGARTAAQKIKGWFGGGKKA